MARIIAGSYMVRYPLGGMMSWTLQWLVGFARQGHEVIFVEKSHYADSCYDPVSKINGNDCSYGLRTVADLLERFGLAGRWCFVDFDGRYHGMSRAEIENHFRSADIFLDLGTHGAWLEEAAHCGVTALVDGEPGYTQIRMENESRASENAYDFYFSNGANVGTSRSNAPTAGKTWHKVFNPVVTDLFPVVPPPADAPFGTVMNWQSHEPCSFQGRSYGQKDVEFAKFLELPHHAPGPMELAVSGKTIPVQDLESAGWRVRDAQEVTVSYDAYGRYIRECRGEFSVCKNVFVAMHTGWFSDRSAAYLASGRPVVLQDTGFSGHLPVGEGLFAVRDAGEAAAALAEIEADYVRHSIKAREIAQEHLEAESVLRAFLHELGH
jgi:hypothetical protein